MGADVDRAADASGYRAEAGVNVVHSFHVRLAVRRNREPIIDPDPFDYEDPVVSFDLPGRLDLVPLRINLDLTRLQRACKRAGQSAAGRCDDVVKRRGARRVLPRIDAVVLGDLGMNPERDGIVLGWKVR
jgi:hypothetical protein